MILPAALHVPSMGVPKPGELAAARGEKDGLNHALKVMGGEQGRYNRGSYPSNLFHQSTCEWAIYNRAFEQGYKSAFRVRLP